MNIFFRCLRHLALCALAIGAALAQAQYSVTTTDAPIPKVREFKTFHLIVVQREFRTPGLATSGDRDKALLDVNFFDFGALASERAPQVFAANGVQARVTLLPVQDGPVPLPSELDPEEGVVVFDAASYSKGSKGLFLRFLTVNFNVLLLESGSPDAQPVAPLWRFGMGLQLGHDPVLGVLKTNRVDAGSVDSLMMGLLNTLGKKGFVALPGGKAVKPQG